MGTQNLLGELQGSSFDISKDLLGFSAEKPRKAVVPKVQRKEKRAAPVKPEKNPPDASGQVASNTDEPNSHKPDRLGARQTGEVKAKGKGKVKAQGVARRSGENHEENSGRIGRPPKSVPESLLKKSIRAAALGMPLERIAVMCGFHGAEAQWRSYLDRNPEFRTDLFRARGEGEADLLLAVDDGVQGWQSKAWLLERARGYTMRAQLEHSGPGGRQLSIAHEVVTALQPG